MDGQLDPVKQDIRNIQERIVRYEHKLALAEQAGNKEEEKSLINLLSSLQEEKNILLRSQAPSKPCTQLVHMAYLCSHHFALLLMNNSILVLAAAFTHDPKGCCQDSHSFGQRKGLDAYGCANTLIINKREIWANHADHMHCIPFHVCIHQLPCRPLLLALSRGVANRQCMGLYCI